MSLIAKPALRALPVAVILIGLVSVAKYFFIDFSLNDNEGRNFLLRICLFILFNSISISGLVAIANARAAWNMLLLSQLSAIIILVATSTFGRGDLTLNSFTLQHFLVVAVAFVLLIFLDVKSKARKK